MSTASLALTLPRRRPLILLAIAASLLLYVFRDGLGEMLAHWATPEFSHGYIIPFVAAAIALREWSRRGTTDLHASTMGILILVLGLAGGALGALATSYSLIQYAFMVCVLGLTASALGWRGVRLFAPAIFYLSFMIPLPMFFLVQLSSGLQRASTDLGVAILQLFAIPTFVEGNVIDLGDMKLQVAEACSGLRYLFPLMSFGFLVAYLFRGSMWQRALLFISAIPIALLMNGLRIGFVGITVTHWGADAAEGFLHLFEGWVVFMVCLALLFGEASLIARFSGSQLLDRLDLGLLRRRQNRGQAPGIQASWQLGACIVLLTGASVFTLVLPHRAETAPQRRSLELFPVEIAQWQGRPIAIDPASLAILKLDDYVDADYSSTASAGSVNLYVAYYASQRNGAAIHSPHNCLPAGGWQVESTRRAAVGAIGPGGRMLQVNRAVVRKGDDRMLVYYWFQERGRIITEEYAAKWLIFLDGITKHRTDGALVRIVTPIKTGGEAAAKARLNGFAALVERQLPAYVPD